MGNCVRQQSETTGRFFVQTVLLFRCNRPTMRPEKSKRIEVNPVQQGLGGLGAALDKLPLGPLPHGEVQDSKLKAQSPPPAEPAKRKTLGRVVLRRETAHRGGRTVIVIHDFPPHFNTKAMEELARELRHALGTGGTVRERRIEMQGDQPGKIRAFLEGAGFQVAGER